MATATPDVISDTQIEEMVNSIFEDLWNVRILNDDITTFEIVEKALTTLFGHTKESAEALAWTVHRTGKAVVATLPKDEAEEGVKALHGYKIQADTLPA